MTAAILTKHLFKTYRLGDVAVQALDDVSLAVAEGAFVSIMGPSGAGKSTLLHLIGLLDEPTSGRITIMGDDTSRLTSRERAAFRLSRIGFVFQFFSLLSGFKSLENTSLPMLLTGASDQESTAAARTALKRVGLGDRLNHRPDELSGGERQRVAIARAIVNQPDIVLADEPTSQLDSASSHTIMGLFQELAGHGHTIVTVNHEEMFGAYADRIIRMEDGKIVDGAVSGP